MLILLKENHELIKSIFKSFDTNGSNKMSSSEVQIALSDIMDLAATSYLQLRGFSKLICPKTYKMKDEAYHRLLDKVQSSKQLDNTT